jgi:uncharacterized protein (TIGR03435 family)
MISGIRALLLLLPACLSLMAQQTLTFEVASVKVSAPMTPGTMKGMMFGMRGGPGRATFSNTSLMNVLTRAFDVKNYQISGPDWLDSERFDFTMKFPEGTTKEQFNVMLQNLLAERFGLKFHRETKDLQGYELVVGKNGPKLKETTLVEEKKPAGDGPPAPPMPPPMLNGPPKTDANGFPVLERAGMSSTMRMGPKGASSHMTARAQTVTALAGLLTMQLRRPVTDKTGLTAKYDFTLEYAPEGGMMGNMRINGMPPPAPNSLDAEESGPTLMSAVQEQLGLKLEARKTPTEMVVIDRMEKTPTEN